MTDRIAWADFRVSFARIKSSHSRAIKANRLEQADGLEMALDELTDAFAHIHVAGNDGETCALCDLTFRHPIHIREADND
jgi:hypothetical protein